MTTPLYKMTIDFNVLEHLGVKLYSNVAAVLTETVANSWDSDASVVNIDFDLDSDTLVITDDGIGMDVQDLNDKYLRVGYRKREAGELITAKSRPVMGRKGLGKLSLFSIASAVKVETMKDGETHGLRLDYDKIKESIESKIPDYVPDALTSSEINIKVGTRISLTKLKKKRLERTEAALKRRLARRFSVIGSDQFRVFVNGEEITASDRDELRIVQFLWNIGDVDYAAECQDLKESVKLDGTIENETIKGWIGTVAKPKQLETDAGNLNSVIVLARGRLLIENVLDKINASGMYTKYLTGQIEADFLDDDDLEDIVTSDRQRVLENDERYEKLLNILKSLLSKISVQWDEWRRKYGTEQVSNEYPSIGDWLNQLPEGYRESAKKLISRIGAMPVEDRDDKRELLKHAIYAFERLRIRSAAHELETALASGTQELLKLLADHASIEGSLYREIVTSRIETIKMFRNLVEEDAKEKVLQQALAKDLWLLDPSWERAGGSEMIESRLKTEGVIVDELTEKERVSRVDIYYRTTARKHLIVELKRAGRTMKLIELQEQGSGYVDKLKKILLQQGEANPHIEVVFVIGPAIAEEGTHPDRVIHSMNAVSPGSRIVHYDGLIESAQKAYAEYLQATETADRIAKITEQL